MSMLSMANWHAFSGAALAILELSGSLEVTAAGDGTRWTTDFSGDNIQLENLTAFLQDGEARIKGPLSGQGNLSGAAGPGREPHPLCRPDRRKSFEHRRDDSQEPSHPLA